MPSLLNRLRHRIARPHILEMRSTLAAMSQSLTKADAEVATLTSEFARTRSDLHDARLDLTHAEALLAASHAPTDPVSDARTPVPAGRRTDAIRAVEWFASTYDMGPTANEIAAVMRARFGYTDNPATIARWVSDVAREGWIAGDGKKLLRFTLTAMGRDALDGAAGERAVAS